MILNLDEWGVGGIYNNNNNNNKSNNNNNNDEGKEQVKVRKKVTGSSISNGKKY